MMPGQQEASRAWSLVCPLLTDGAHAYLQAAQAANNASSAADMPVPSPSGASHLGLDHGSDRGDRNQGAAAKAGIASGLDNMHLQFGNMNMNSFNNTSSFASGFDTTSREPAPQVLGTFCHWLPTDWQSIRSYAWQYMQLSIVCLD